MGDGFLVTFTPPSPRPSGVMRSNGRPVFLPSGRTYSTKTRFPPGFNTRRVSERVRTRSCTEQNVRVTITSPRPRCRSPRRQKAVPPRVSGASESAAGAIRPAFLHAGACRGRFDAHVLRGFREVCPVGTDAYAQLDHTTRDRPVPHGADLAEPCPHAWLNTVKMQRRPRGPGPGSSWNDGDQGQEPAPLRHRRWRP